MPPAAPYVLSPTTFPFPALAALAGRAPLGGEREVVLACFMAAHLASALLEGQAGLPRDARTARAAGARLWCASLALPAATRVPLARLVEATAGDSRPAVAAALTKLSDVTQAYTDAGARAELQELARALTASS